jgi:hypothetical protein
MRSSISIIILLLSFSALIIFADRALVAYRVDKEWMQIWVNKDGSIDILYNITLTYTSGSPEGIVTIGMPKKDFQIQYVKDIEGNSLEYNPISNGDFHGVEIKLRGPVNLNKPNTMIVYAVVPEMIYKDESNPGNVGLKIYPSTFDDAEAPIGNIRAAIVLPEDVREDEIKYLAVPRSIFRNEEGSLVIYWESSDWPSYEEFWIGVSFPEKYVSIGPNIWYYITVGGAIAIFSATVVIAAAIALRRIRKSEYEKPKVAIEALGPARGLTAVEAAVVLDLKPVRVLTMIIFGLLLKRVITVVSTDPVIKLKRLDWGDSERVSLRYYEIDFLDALRPDGSLNEALLAKTYLNLKETVNLKLRGFSRVDTVNYYKSIVDRAWQQVTQAGMPELKCDALEENIEWLLADERFEEKIKVAFPPDIIVYPRPDWWWYWHGPRFPTKTGGEVKPTPIPGQDFANSIVLALEKTANNIVKNVQEFANRLVPAQRVSVSQKPLRYPSCVCACASCACACACVSCACACAHGGAR